MTYPLTYNPKGIILIIGTHIATGFTEGEFISYQREVPHMSHVTDIHSNTIRVPSGNNTGILTVTFTQASPTNDVLSGLYNLDKNLKTGTFPLSFRETNGTTLCSSLGAWIEDLTPITYSNVVTDRQWRIILSNAGDYAGGLNR